MSDCIIIPSCKAYKEVEQQIEDIKRTAPDWEVIFTGLKACAATNRNAGLEMASWHDPQHIIQTDDDISGYFPGWADLLRDALSDCVNMTSARLMHNESTPGIMMNHPVDMSGNYQFVREAVPSSCICFRYGEVYFDNRFNINNIGSGYDDTDGCYRLNQNRKNDLYCICNNVKLIHKNEMKNQREYMPYFEHLFRQKWGIK